VIQALPRILSRHPDVVYIIAGATHPHVRRREGDRYRLQLEALAKDLGVGQNVVFYNRFVSPQEMAALVGSADIYVTPYRYETQAVSGTLAYALGAGKRSFPTPYCTPPNSWATGRRLVPSRTQRLLQIRRLNFGQRCRPRGDAQRALISMHATWYGGRCTVLYAGLRTSLRQSHATCPCGAAHPGCREEKCEPIHERLSSFSGPGETTRKRLQKRMGRKTRPSANETQDSPMRFCVSWGAKELRQIFCCAAHGASKAQLGDVVGKHAVDIVKLRARQRFLRLNHSNCRPRLPPHVAA